MRGRTLTGITIFGKSSSIYMARWPQHPPHLGMTVHTHGVGGGEVAEPLEPSPHRSFLMGIIWALKKWRLTFISAYKVRVTISLMFIRKYLLLRWTVFISNSVFIHCDGSIITCDYIKAAFPKRPGSPAICNHLVRRNGHAFSKEKLRVPRQYSSLL